LPLLFIYSYPKLAKVVIIHSMKVQFIPITVGCQLCTFCKCVNCLYYFIMYLFTKRKFYNGDGQQCMTYKDKT